MTENFYALLAARFGPLGDTIASKPRPASAIPTPSSTGKPRATLNCSRRSASSAATRLALQVEKSPQALFAYLGGLRAGLVCLPLNTGYRDLEIDYFLDNAEPGLLVCAPERLEAPPGWPPRAASGSAGPGRTRPRQPV